jgi:hypothetical protein
MNNYLKALSGSPTCASTFIFAFISLLITLITTPLFANNPGFGFFSSDSDYDANYTPNISSEYIDRPTVIDDSTAINIAASNNQNTDKNIDNNSKYGSDNNPASQNQPTVLTTREHKTKFSKNDIYYGKELCGNGEFTCIKLKKGDSWKSLFPDEYQRELVQRLNRTNRAIWGRSWILVPNDFSKNYLKYSPLPATRATNNQKTIIVSQNDLAFGAYDENGNLVHWGPANPGKPGTRTIHGDNFQIYRKGGAGCWSKKFEAPIPYCMFFHGGFALHGFNLPGYAASHGCVRIYNSDAKWLNKEFANYKTKVVVE